MEQKGAREKMDGFVMLRRQENVSQVRGRFRIVQNVENRSEDAFQIAHGRSGPSAHMHAHPEKLKREVVENARHKQGPAIPKVCGERGERVKGKQVIAFPVKKWLIVVVAV